MTKQFILFATGMLCLFGNTSVAQDSLSFKKSNTFNHRLGIQVNELVRQVLNFNGNNGNVLNNPYLLTYSLTLAKPGIGIRVGVGPEYNTFKNDDGITKVENSINKINARIGVEKVFKLSGRWSAGAGADFVYANDVSYSKTVVRSFDSTTTDLATRLESMGGGGMAWLQYHVTSNVLIGTEASFYYRTGKAKQKLTITRKTSVFGGVSKFETTTDELDNDVKEALFRLPMVLYLIVKF